eukprot:TRINITY_DN7006_c0_g1_i1.p1 TRINITY_DN7006_c0_g1~~TRINITY_DN7006_c0_g1_i1.p1  ORF type:complete len:230 (+),score=25.16 TRINITY_DN7006_c0_g1_i1:23-691(+)
MCSCDCSSHRGLTIASLVLVILIFILNFFTLLGPLYHYEPDIAAYYGIRSNSLGRTSATEIFIGLFRTVLERGITNDVTEDTVNIWKLLYPSCDYYAMESQTKALQGFWVLSQTSCLLLLVFLSIKLCCKKDFSNWFMFGTNIFLFVSFLIASALVGYQYNFEFCGKSSLSDGNYDLSAGASFLFVSLVVIFIVQIFVCLTTLYFKDEEPSSKHNPDDDLEV